MLSKSFKAYSLFLLLLAGYLGYKSQLNVNRHLKPQKLGHRFICVKKEEPEELVCESEESYTESDPKTKTGNILERLIRDPQCRRSPYLGNWPEDFPKSDSDFGENRHQFRAAQKTTHITQMCSLKVSSEPHPLRQPAIICTIGPASNNVNSIVELLEAGMNIARISMAHADPYALSEPVRNVIEAGNQYSAVKDFEIPIGIFMDLKGPQIRTGKMNYNRRDLSYSDVLLKPECYIRLTCDEIFAERCSDKVIYVDYPNLIDTVKEGMIVLISDGKIQLKVDTIELVCILCTIITGGVLKSHQKVHIKGLPLSLPPLTDYDKTCLELAADWDVDVVGIAKTRNAEAIKQAKMYLGAYRPDHNILLFAKISNYEGLERIDSILGVADGIIIDETDLCLDLTPEKMLVAQKMIVAKCNKKGKPIWRTGDFSFESSPDGISKRIAMCDVGGAVVDGADGIILIKDTALDPEGPANVAQLSTLLSECEAATMQTPFFSDLVSQHTNALEPCQAIALGAVQISNIIQATAILAVTTSGKTAQMLSWYRPRCPVIAISRNSKTARQLNCWRAVVPLHFSAPVLPDWFHDIKVRYQYAIAFGKEKNMIHAGDLLVLVSGYRKKAGFTNCIRIVFVTPDKYNYDDNLSGYFTSSREILSNGEKPKL